ncbi:YeeE/YedE family protein [Pseudorhodobacter turbinis]|uniref:YeeE/YedE family protein n=1 Tax=Pseudorhodobacter turbinis TaxID=2500533 RepID=A0A4P8EG06_9RHOB|nr:YeeE/YedE family protein [Pseudorhodobacter turbinis]QCO55642.1 YeeE/YedE family protein [Pseudorhodobacter turbinis]
MEEVPFGVWAAFAGLIAGVVLGLSARLGDFCTLGALESALYGEDQRRLRLWGVVLAVAIFGTHLGDMLGVIDIGGTFYHQIAWNPLASIAGGLLFGYGMAMAGNCGFGALVRFGGGDLRSLVVVVVMGIFAFVALSGPLAPIRNALFPQVDATGLQGIAHVLNVPPLVTAGVISLGLLIWALAHPGLRGSPRQLMWGVAAGAAVVWSFAATTWLSVESFGAVQVEGLSFTAPLGRTLIWLMTSTAGGISFSVGAVCGVMLGALAGSLWRGLFRWEACEDPRELGRQVSGAAMMGVGGVTALGCSVGQGVSAFATLAWSGPVTLAAIALGAVFGLRRLIGGFQPE